MNSISFRSIGSGLLGEWRKKPGKELQSYAFIPTAPHPYGLSDIGPGRHTAIFFTNGSEHGIIFADPVKIEFESIPGATPIHHIPRPAMGTFTTKSGECPEILNPDRILRS